MAEAPNVPGKWGRFCKEALPDAVLGELADQQHGVVALWQLRALGLSDSAVHKRAVARRLYRVHRGVYAVGRRGLTERGYWMAAVLACGPDAALSHRAAAALLGLRPDNRSRIDVTVPRRAARRRSGIDVHVTETLRAKDLTSWDGIPCTSVARTLLDLGDVVGRSDVQRAVEQAEVLRLFDLRLVEDALSRAGPRRGAGLLRAAIRDRSDNGVTESELEEAFLQLCRAAALPQPVVNAWIALDDRMVKADFLWRVERLVVETDGHAFHGTPQAFERDRRRDQLLTLAGFKILRFTWRQVTIEPDGVAETIGALL